MPQITKGLLVKKVNLTGNYWLFTLEFPIEFLFLAGQYVSVKVADDGSRRSYSIASAPGGKVIELMIDVGPMGLGSKFFLALNEGDSVEVMGPMGHFVLAKPTKSILFVATGSGIVPFRPMINELLEKRGFKGNIHLDWGMRFEEDLFWIDEFRKLEQDHPNFMFDVVLSKPTKEWYACSGHVNDCLLKHRQSWEGWEVYLCGNQQMIADASTLLVKLGVEEYDIHFEKFF